MNIRTNDDDNGKKKPPAIVAGRQNLLERLGYEKKRERWISSRIFFYMLNFKKDHKIV